MGFPTYTLRPDETAFHRDDLGAVIRWDTTTHAGALFHCPCGERLVRVESPPHDIAFDDQGRLTIQGSCGSHAMPELGWDKHHCHFFIQGGEVEMCGDAKCPGRDLT